MPTNLFTKLQTRLRAIPGAASKVIWLPIERHDDIWVDSYTRTNISNTEWLPGFPYDDDSQSCGIYPVPEGYVNFECTRTIR